MRKEGGRVPVGRSQRGGCKGYCIVLSLVVFSILVRLRQKDQTQKEKPGAHMTRARLSRGRGRRTYVGATVLSGASPCLTAEQRGSLRWGIKKQTSGRERQMDVVSDSVGLGLRFARPNQAVGKCLAIVPPVLSPQHACPSVLSLISVLLCLCRVLFRMSGIL